MSSLKDRVVHIAMTAGAAAAVTATLLWLFQDSADALGRNGTEIKKQPPRVRASEDPADAVVQSAAQRESDESREKREQPLVSAGIPRVGDGSALADDYISGILYLSNLAARTEHGAGFVDMGPGAGVAVIVARPALARAVLSKETAHALGAMVPASQAFFGNQVLFVLEGKEWRSLRGMMRPPFAPHALGNVAEQAALSVARDLCEAIRADAQAGRPVDMHAMIARYHLAVVGLTAFGSDMDCRPSELETSETCQSIVNAFEYMLRELPRRVYSADTAEREDYSSDTPQNREWRKHASAVREVVDKAVQRRLESKRDADDNDEEKKDLLDCVLDAYEKEHGERATDSSRITAAAGDNLVETLFAGYNTSVGVMAVALYYLAVNPQWLEPLQQEVDAVLEDLRVGDSFDMNSLPLVRAVLYEALRLVPPAPLVYRSMQRATDLGDGLVLPAGTSVWIPALFLHLESQSWGSDAASFNPGRWLKKGDEPVHPPGAFVPFSHGARECLGRHFAMLESTIALALLLKEFSFSVAPSYEFHPTFTGFGLRPMDAATQTVCLNLVPHERVQTGDFMFDWSPQRSGERRGRGRQQQQDSDSDDEGAEDHTKPSKLSFSPLAA